MRANCRLPLEPLGADALLVTDPHAKRQAAYGVVCLKAVHKGFLSGFKRRGEEVAARLIAMR
jgi:hypothetical protein